VSGDSFRVIGESYVLVYDGSFWSREGHEQKKLPDKEHLFYMLRSGDQYNMLQRKVID
jgi:cyanophycinase